MRLDSPVAVTERVSARERRIQSQAVDVARFLLPAASLANVGVTANARVLEHAIQKLLSHPLNEVREIGAEIKRAAQAEVPTLVKYADEVPYLRETAQALQAEAAQLPTTTQPEGEWCRLVDFDPKGEARVLAAALFRFGEMRYADAWEYVHSVDNETRLHLANQLLGRLARHDIPLRELEYTDYTFEVNLDQGAYFELKRHRMMAQTPQALTTRLGYSLPRLIVEAGVEKPYRTAMDAAAQLYERLVAFNPEVAAYVVPNGYYRRVLIHFNLRTAFHLCTLRAAPNAHFSMRRLALCLAEQIRAVHPALGTYGLSEAVQDWRDVDREHFAG
ncbi:MAG TPA: FAD-dependent thymidylate synthase [Anaerolineaceae bacterium]|nr:FAD-dependent thymidylate synthase [Anaerolineaceae bacterium]